MKPAWKEIWGSEARVDRFVLEILLKASGFSKDEGGFSSDEWREYVAAFYQKLDLEAPKSVYEVGCGSGAFLYLLQQKGITIGGIDYSKPLIDLAKKIIPQGRFTCSEANSIDEKEKMEVVFSPSVFHYFKDLDYAEGVILKMISKASKKVAFLDVNDAAKEANYHAQRAHKEATCEADYQKKYQGLEHLFFEKRWFEKIAQQANIKQVEIFDQTAEKYKNTPLRFNVIMSK